MVGIIRLLLMIAAPIASFFVSRDALNFGVVEALIVMIFISAFVGWAAWSGHKKRA